MASSKEMDQVWESKEVKGRTFSFRQRRGRTQVAGSMSKSQSAEAAEKSWAEAFGMPGRVSGRLLPAPAPGGYAPRDAIGSSAEGE